MEGVMPRLTIKAPNDRGAANKPLFLRIVWTYCEGRT